MSLQDDHALEQSPIVANCRMNRERNLLGTNGYDRELRFNPVELLSRNGMDRDTVGWLDLCCGSGKALIEAAELALSSELNIVGVDLVGMFRPHRHPQSRLRLVQSSLHDWSPQQQFDLITCVHGLHYLGDKIGLVTRAMGWLKEDGLLVANLDLHNICLEGKASSSRILNRLFRKQGIEYSARNKLIRRQGRLVCEFPLRYLGADDQAGPNYTGQEAVNSHYRATH